MLAAATLTPTLPLTGEGDCSLAPQGRGLG